MLPSPRLAFVLPWFMAKRIVVTRKKRGPPPTGKGIQIGERWHPPELAAIDKWIAANGKMTRGQAVRRLVELGLKANVPARRASDKQKARAKELAGDVIDGMSEAAASAQDQASRKLRLIKGPSGFREVRVDGAKKK